MRNRLLRIVIPILVAASTPALAQTTVKPCSDAASGVTLYSTPAGMMKSGTMRFGGVQIRVKASTARALIRWEDLLFQGATMRIAAPSDEDVDAPYSFTMASAQETVFLGARLNPPPPEVDRRRGLGAPTYSMGVDFTTSAEKILSIARWDDARLVVRRSGNVIITIPFDAAAKKRELDRLNAAWKVIELEYVRGQCTPM